MKDSYGNAEIPFYTGSFEEIYVTDMRYFDCNLVNFIQDRGVTDVLFSMCSYSVVGTNANGLSTLIAQYPDQHLTDGQEEEEAAASPSPSVSPAAEPETESKSSEQPAEASASPSQN